MEANLRTAGRPAACATAERPRCGTCRNCLNKAAKEAKRREEIAAAAARLAGTPPAPVPPSLKGGYHFTVNGEALQPPAGDARPTPGLVHRTKASLPKISVMQPSPWDWSTFGPLEPAAPKTDEERQEEETHEEARARVENPSATAVMAAGFMLEWFRKNIDECVAKGLKLPMTDNPKVMAAFYEQLGQMYLHSAARHLPDLDPTDLQIDLMTGGSLVASEVLKYLANKRATAAPEVQDERKAAAIDVEESTPAPAAAREDDDQGVFA